MSDRPSLTQIGQPAPGGLPAQNASAEPECISLLLQRSIYFIAHSLYYVTNLFSNTVVMDNKPPFDAAALGLKEIGNLASWTVSSSKPGCGVAALRDDDTNLFWQ